MWKIQMKLAASPKRGESRVGHKLCKCRQAAQTKGQLPSPSPPSAQAQAQPGLIVHTVAPLVWPIRPTTRWRPNCRRNFDSMLRHSNKTVHQRPPTSHSHGILLLLHKKRSTFYGWLKYAGLLQLPSLWIPEREECTATFSFIRWRSNCLNI